MKPWGFLRGLLPALAVAGLLLAPIAAPAGAHAVAIDTPVTANMPIAMNGEMPCCPDEAPAPLSDCSKDCPLMALCMAKVVQDHPTAALALPFGVFSRTLPMDAQRLASLSASPPRPPPKA